MQSFLEKPHKVYQLWQNQWLDENQNQNFKSFLIRIGSVLLLYVILDRILLQITQIPLEHYYNTFIFFIFIKHIFTNWYFLYFVTLAIFVAAFRKKLFSPWTDFEKGKSVRYLVMIAAGTLTWVFVTFSFNLYFNQGYYFDRLLIFALLLLIYWRPVFVFPFLVIYLPMIWQITFFPTSAFVVFHVPFRLLILFCSFFLIYLSVKKFPIADFVFLVGCLIPAHYWLSGLGKVNLTWIIHDQIYLLLPATYLNGWLSFLDKETISSITQTLSYFNLPMKLCTIIIEFGAIFFLWNRYTIRFFLVGWIILHLGICFVSGIFFWYWLVFEIAFLWLFIKKEGFSELPIFTTKHLIVSIFLIITGMFWLKPAKLAWFDVPVSYVYRFEAETADGKTYQLPPNFFSPYDNQFTLSNFRYLDDNPRFPIIWGASAFGVDLKMLKIESADELLSFEKTNGKNSYDEKTKKDFELFLKQFIKNYNNRNSNETFLNYVQAPRTILTYPTSVSFENTKLPIKKIKIFHVTSFYNKGKYKEIRNYQLTEIYID